MFPARPLRLLATVTTVVLALSTASLGNPSEKTVGKPVKTFPATAVVGMPKRKFPVQFFEGRALLVQFFGTYSERESDAVPHLNKLRDQLGPKGLSILAVTSAGATKMVDWMKEHGARYAACCVDSDTNDAVLGFYEYPGMPWSYLVGLDGTIVWQGHPQALKAPQIERHLVGAWAPPRLPPSWTAEQALLDQGLFGAAREKLEARATETVEDKQETRRLQGWARGVVAWIDGRAAAVFDEAAKMEKDGLWWDAWQVYDEFPKRFAGRDGTERAAELAAAVRANEAAKEDLELGDRVARAAELLKDGKTKKAQLIISRIRKSHPKSRHAARCHALLNPLE